MPRIVLHPHPALRYLSRPITEIDDDLRSSVRTMFDLMYQSRGIGLAANQVALPFRFFVLNLTADPSRSDQEQVFINPVIVKRHSSIEEEEGCLSFPGIHAEVHRARKIKVRAFDLEGVEIEVDAADLLSRAIQHEIDHLDGKLFLDNVDPRTLKGLEGKLQEFERCFRQAQRLHEYPSDEDLRRRLDEMKAPSLRLAQPEEPPALDPLASPLTTSEAAS